MAILLSSTSSRPSATADAVDDVSAERAASPAESDDGVNAANGTKWPTLERLADVWARCEGSEAEWWQALVVGFALSHGHVATWIIDRAREHGPESVYRQALAIIEERCMFLAGCTPAVMAGGRIRDSLETQRSKHEAIDAAQAAVLDELELFYRRDWSGFSDENLTEISMTAATKPTSRKADRKPKPATPPESNDDLLYDLFREKSPLWTDVRINGADDAMLLQALRKCLPHSLPNPDFPTQREATARDWKSPDGWNLAVWFDTTTASPVRPDLSGQALLNRMRDLLRIAQPHELVEHFTPKGQANDTWEPKATKTTKKPAATANSGIVILETIDVPLAKIRRSPFQTRSEPDKAWVQEVAESLRVDGQTTPGLGRWVGDDFELIAGHTRWAAAESIDWITLRCEVCNVDDATAARLVYIENAKHRSLTAIDKANGLKMTADQYAAADRTQAECAADLGISESQLSNMLRLLRLPAEWQTRVAAGELSIEQSRALATWVDFPHVIKAFGDKCKEMGVSEGPIDKHHFENGLRNATERGSRPMSKDQYGRGCLFTPTEDERKELDIREVKSHWGGSPSKRAFNVPLWNKLQTTAKKKKKEREEKAATKQGDKPKKEKHPRGYGFASRIEDAWQLAFRGAIGQKIGGKQKLTKAEKSLVSRAGLFVHFDVQADEAMRWTVEQLEEKFFSEAHAAITRKLRNDWDDGGVALEVLQLLATSLGCDPVQLFQINKRTLEPFGDADLVTLANQMDLPSDGSRDAQITRLVAGQWPRDDIPKILQLAPPKKPKAKKGS